MATDRGGISLVDTMAAKRAIVLEDIPPDGRGKGMPRSTWNAHNLGHTPPPIKANAAFRPSRRRHHPGSNPNEVTPSWRIGMPGGLWSSYSLAGPGPARDLQMARVVPQQSAYVVERPVGICTLGRDFIFSGRFRQRPIQTLVERNRHRYPRTDPITRDNAGRRRWHPPIRKVLDPQRASHTASAPSLCHHAPAQNRARSEIGENRTDRMLEERAPTSTARSSMNRQATSPGA